jgi:hypothetical protein
MARGPRPEAGDQEGCHKGGQLQQLGACACALCGLQSTVCFYQWCWNALRLQGLALSLLTDCLVSSASSNEHSIRRRCMLLQDGIQVWMIHRVMDWLVRFVPSVMLGS